MTKIKKYLLQTGPILFFLLYSLLFGKDNVYALQPPRPGEIEELQRTGQFEERKRSAESLGNHKVDPYLLQQALIRTKRTAFKEQGLSSSEINALAPLTALPSGRRGMPTKGQVKIFALLIDFNDYPATESAADINNKLFGAGNPEDFPYESLASYYLRSSYGLLDLSGGTTLGWYRPSYNRSAVEMTDQGREKLIKEALNYFKSTGHDFSQYDNDGDGYIDYFAVFWAGPMGQWASFWWGMYVSGWSDNAYLISGKRLKNYSWQPTNLWTDMPFDATVVIHETGHALGLPDYYDYDPTVGPQGGLGGLDMMDHNEGDHNSFSKWLLDWTTPKVVSNGSQSLTLNPSGTSPDAVLIWPGVTTNDVFSEFFMAQNRFRAGNDDIKNQQSTHYPADGMLVWHIDARLNANGDNFLYDNSWTGHKLLRLMEADGLEEIEQYYDTNGGDYYTAGMALGPCTVPSSKRYDGSDSFVRIANISSSGQQMTATFTVDNAISCRNITVAKAGTGYGTISGSANSGFFDIPKSTMIFSRKNEANEIITLTPTASPGSVFSRWTGCDNVNNIICTVILSGDKTVTASFTASGNNAASSIRLPETGQIHCFDSDGARIACAGTGQDGELQSGVPWPDPRFIKNADDTMYDNLTGLVWTKDTNAPGPSACSPGVAKTWQKALDYVACLNTNNYLDQKDWRLPNINELESLLNAGDGYWMFKQGFRNDIFRYWSSTTYAANTTYAWGFDTWFGLYEYVNKTDSRAVSPVRGGQAGLSGNSGVGKTGQTQSYYANDDGALQEGVGWPSPRFTDNGNTVADGLTGLLWTKDADAPGPSVCNPGGTKTWQQALDYVTCLNTNKYLGSDDWRLPNRKELLSLVDRSRHDPDILPPNHPFNNVIPSSYWSSTTWTLSGATEYAWWVSMSNGYMNLNVKKGSNYVWPVRSGQTGSFNDVPSGYWAYDYINAIFNAGITSGCGNGNYCPESLVTRAQMAVFVVKALGEQPAAACTGTVFNDVNANMNGGEGFCRYIEKFRELNITAGCAVDNPNTPQNEAAYCPDNNVTRAQMAVFLTKALAQQPSVTCTGTIFNDVNAGMNGGDAFCRYIEKFRELDITAGCAANNPNTPQNEAAYCPNNDVTRAQMAVFLTKGFLQ